jgi:FeS assembly SUF system protein
MGIRDRIRAKARKALGRRDHSTDPIPTWKPQNYTAPSTHAEVEAEGAVARPSNIPDAPENGQIPEHVTEALKRSTTEEVESSNAENGQAKAGVQSAFSSNHDLDENSTARQVCEDDDADVKLQEAVIEQIQTVFDPEIPVNIWALGLIYLVTVKDEGALELLMTLTSPNCPAAQSMPAEITTKCESIDGINSVNIELVWEPAWGPDKMTEEARLELNF